jgi:hypothetical protein
MIVVPVTHDLIHLAAVHTARLLPSLLDEVAEERGAWRKRHMVDVAVQGLVHSEHELSHTHFLFLRGAPVRFWLRYAIGRKAKSTDFISQLVFGMRMNAPRSDCPINLTLETPGIAGA